MGRARTHALRALLNEDVSSLGQCPCGIDHIVHDNDILALDLSDCGDGSDNIGPLPGLVADDVKSARPLRLGRHTCYNGGYRGMLPREGVRILKGRLSSDWSLQPDSTKLDSTKLETRILLYLAIKLHKLITTTNNSIWQTVFIPRFIRV